MPAPGTSLRCDARCARVKRRAGAASVSLARGANRGVLRQRGSTRWRGQPTAGPHDARRLLHITWREFRARRP